MRAPGGAVNSRAIQRPSMDEDRVFSCANCGAEVTRAEASVRETMGDLDPDRWQTLCCPVCGARLETVFLDDG